MWKSTTIWKKELKNLSWVYWSYGELLFVDSSCICMTVLEKLAYIYNNPTIVNLTKFVEKRT